MKGEDGIHGGLARSHHDDGGLLALLGAHVEPRRLNQAIGHDEHIAGRRRKLACREMHLTLDSIRISNCRGIHGSMAPQHRQLNPRLLHHACHHRTEMIQHLSPIRQIIPLLPFVTTTIAVTSHKPLAFPRRELVLGLMQTHKSIGEGIIVPHATPFLSSAIDHHHFRTTGEVFRGRVQRIDSGISRTDYGQIGIDHSFRLPLPLSLRFV
mmetsp:Transcript_37848/g.45710  ORF Transcript_37848/g.45710 Transcript_37848/m.45710 type:complete len:210 (-) Transcript_37848:69-698(-)